jgi:hypothetical protein
VTRSRGSNPEDRVVAEESAPERLYRLFAVEPHGWSTVLLEDQLGSIYVASSVTGDLTEISVEDARQRLTDRVYRLWNGERRWSPLESLPLVASAFARDIPQSPFQDTDGAV